MALKSASDQCPAMAPAMAPNSWFKARMARPVAAVEISKTKPQRVLPGFGLTLGYTMVYLSLLVLIPLSAVFIRSLGLGWGHFWDVVTAPRVTASLRLSFGASLIAALINVIFGLIVAWVLVRYTFPFKRLIDAFIGLPFVVRTLQPVLEDLDREVEQAAATLGASAAQAFVRVILPALWPALLTGFALAFARAVGEYGSVIFIAGNMPMKSEIAPLLIVTKLEQYDYAGATAIAVVMLVLSFALMFGINALQHWAMTRHGGR